MDTIDWTVFTRRISIHQEAAMLFNAWSSQSALETWFLSSAVFYRNGIAKNPKETIEVGDSYRWMWHGSENIVEGEVLGIENFKRIKFTFLGCIVDVHFKNEEGENLIELLQSDIPSDEESKLNYYVECTRGWTFYLANLKSILEGGIDLRNKNMGLKQVINT